MSIYILTKVQKTEIRKLSNSAKLSALYMEVQDSSTDITWSLDVKETVHSPFLNKIPIILKSIIYRGRIIKF